MWGLLPGDLRTDSASDLGLGLGDLGKPVGSAAAELATTLELAVVGID